MERSALNSDGNGGDVLCDRVDSVTRQTFRALILLRLSTANRHHCSHPNNGVEDCWQEDYKKSGVVLVLNLDLATRPLHFPIAVWLL